MLHNYILLGLFIFSSALAYAWYIRKTFLRKSHLFQEQIIESCIKLTDDLGQEIQETFLALLETAIQENSAKSIQLFQSKTDEIYAVTNKALENITDTSTILSTKWPTNRIRQSAHS